MRNEEDTLTLAQLLERLRDDIQQLFKVRANLVWVELQEKLSQVLKLLALALLILIFIPLGFLFLNVGLILFLYYQWRWSLPLSVLTSGGVNFLLGGGVALLAFFWPRSRAPLPEQQPEDVALVSPAIVGEDREQARKELEESAEKGEEEIAQTLSAMRDWAKAAVSWKEWVKDYPIESVAGALVLGLWLGYRYRPPVLPSILPSINGLILGTLRSSARSFLINRAIKRLKRHFFDEEKGERKKGEGMAQIPRSVGWAPPDGRFKEEGVSRGRVPK